VQVAQRPRKRIAIKRDYKNEAMNALSALRPCKLFLNA